MKKLMFTLAIALVAGIVQAASVSWAFGTKNTIMDSSGTQLTKSIDIYLFNTDATDYSKTVAGLANGTIKAADITSAAGYLGSAVTGTKGTTWGKLETNPSTASSGSIVAGGEYHLVFVAFEGDKYYLSGSSTATGWDGSDEYPSATATQASWTSVNFSTANWKTPSGGVPEPTSGILLVLGGAMLALRRRRA